MAALSLTALVLVVIYAVKRRAEDELKYDQSKANNQISNPQFTIVPISRSNLQTSKNDFKGSCIKENMTNCLRSNTRSCSSRTSEMTDSTEFDYYDYTNRAPNDGCYGNGGTVVHV